MWVPLHRRPSFAFNRKRRRVEQQPQEVSPFLDEPVTDHLKEENVEINGLEIGHSSMQGYRVSMEDEHIIDRIESVPDHTIVAVMDGEQIQSHSARYNHINFLMCSYLLFENMIYTHEKVMLALFQPFSHLVS